MTLHRLVTAALLAGTVMAAALGFVESAAAAVEGRSCAGEPTDMRIGYGDLIDCDLTPIGDDDVFRFAGGSGETIKIQTSRLGGGVQCFQLFDPQGTPLDATRCGNASRDYVLAQTGDHTIIILESGINETVTYALALERVDPPSPAALPIDYNDVINDQLNAVGDADFFYFAGQAGDTVKVQSSRLLGGVQCFQLYAPDGVAVDAVRCGNSSRDYGLEQTGTYGIVMLESGLNETVDYALTLACVAGVCPATAPPAVSGCVARRGAPLANRRVNLLQADETTQRTVTDVRGCYAFDRVVAGKAFQLRLNSRRAR